MATLHSFQLLVEGAPPDPLLNPTRQRLAEAIAALERARAEVKLSAEPVRRLSDRSRPCFGIKKLVPNTKA